MLQAETQDREMSAVMRALAEGPQELERGMRLLDAGFRLTPELYVDLWLQDAGARLVIALGEGSGGETALLGRAWCVVSEVRRMRSLLERLFQRAGVTFEQPRVVLVASRFSDVLMGAREELARSSIELVEARLLTDGGGHRLVVVRAGGGSSSDAPPAADSPTVQRRVAATVAHGNGNGNGNGHANGNGNGHGNGHGVANGSKSNGHRATAPRAAPPVEPLAPSAAPPAIDHALVDELKRKLARISDAIEEETVGSATRFLYHEQPLVTLDYDEGQLVALLGEGDEPARPLADRGALHAVIDEVVRLYFIRTRQQAQLPRSAATSAPR
ncbi:MAG: hypothetical protein JNL90_18520 [Planctomycetes bacterium]|nr:hypothetical protein [Planctomycetota bacterium]